MRHLLTRPVVLIILVTVTFYSCKKVDRPKEQRVPKGSAVLGGNLRIAEKDKPEVLLPFQVSSAVSSRIGSQLHCGLLRFDPKTLEIIPGIAETWSVDDAGTSYVFNLRKGAKFHDDECFGNGSREITANDFLFSFRELCKPEGGKAFDTTFKGRVLGADAFRNGESEGLAGVEMLDDYTLRIRLEKPDPSFLFVLAQPSTAVISPKALAAYGSQNIIGAGPFVLVSNDEVLLMTRNQDYFDEDEFGNNLPYIDTLMVYFIPSREEQLEAFFSNKLDVVSGIYPDPVRKILEQHISEFSGKDPKYVMQRETDDAGYESYSIFRKQVKDFAVNFMGYQDYSNIQLSN